MSVYNREREELVHIAGTAPANDPVTGKAGGYVSSLNLAANPDIQHPLVRYKDRVIECDVYFAGASVTAVDIVCPRCQNALRISAERKQIFYDPNHQREDGGRLSVERFECTWEAEPGGRRMEFGLGLCRWSAEIDNNVARDV